MVFVVERYLTGLTRPAIARALERLEVATRELQADGIAIRYLGSTIVAQDEACFCQFEAPSAETVEAVNRRARFAFDRIVAAVAVAPAGREEER
ncbi:MAG TPA: nickel-binding protein [Gaiellaceae bacterium]|nr:nickel-binding protein [Gaiellaceae bacterium]